MKCYLVLFALTVAATNVAANNVAASSGCTDDVAAKDSGGWHYYAKTNVCKKGYETWYKTWRGAFQTMIADENKAHTNEGWQNSWQHMKTQFGLATGKDMDGTTTTPVPSPSIPTWNTQPTTGRFVNTNGGAAVGDRFKPTATGSWAYARNPKQRMESDDSEDDDTNPWKIPTTHEGTSGNCAPICTMAIGIKSSGNDFVTDPGLNDAPGAGFANPGEKFLCYKACMVEGGGMRLRMNGASNYNKLKAQSASVNTVIANHFGGNSPGWGYLTISVKILAMKEVRCINPNWRNQAQYHTSAMWSWVDSDGNWHKDSPAEIFAQAIKEMNDDDSSLTMSYGNKANCLNLGAKTAGGSSSIGRDTRKWQSDKSLGDSCWGDYQSGTPACATNSAVSPASLMKCDRGGPEYIRDHANRAAAEIAYLRLCKPCATTCKVRKSCRILGAKLTHVGQDSTNYPVDGSDGGNVAVEGIQEVAGTALCSNF